MGPSIFGSFRVAAEILPNADLSQFGGPINTIERRSHKLLPKSFHWSQSFHHASTHSDAGKGVEGSSPILFELVLPRLQNGNFRRRPFLSQSADQQVFRAFAGRRQCLALKRTSEVLETTRVRPVKRPPLSTSNPKHQATGARDHSSQAGLL